MIGIVGVVIRLFTATVWMACAPCEGYIVETSTTEFPKFSLTCSKFNIHTCPEKFTQATIKSIYLDESTSKSHLVCDGAQQDLLTDLNKLINFAQIGCYSASKSTAKFEISVSNYITAFNTRCAASAPIQSVIKIRFDFDFMCVTSQPLPLPTEKLSASIPATQNVFTTQNPKTAMSSIRAGSGVISTAEILREDTSETTVILQEAATESESESADTTTVGSGSANQTTQIFQTEDTCTTGSESTEDRTNTELEPEGTTTPGLSSDNETSQAVLSGDAYTTGFGLPKPYLPGSESAHSSVTGSMSAHDTINISETPRYFTVASAATRPRATSPIDERTALGHVVKGETDNSRAQTENTESFWKFFETGLGIATILLTVLVLTFFILLMTLLCFRRRCTCFKGYEKRSDVFYERQLPPTNNVKAVSSGLDIRGRLSVMPCQPLELNNYSELPSGQMTSLYDMPEADSSDGLSDQARVTRSYRTPRAVAGCRLSNNVSMVSPLDVQLWRSQKLADDENDVPLQSECFSQFSNDENYTNRTFWRTTVNSAGQFYMGRSFSYMSGIPEAPANLSSGMNDAPHAKRDEYRDSLWRNSYYDNLQ